jgi:hypothetical protein
MSARHATVRNRPDLRITYDSPETTRAEQVRFVARQRCVDCAACIASRGPASPPLQVRLRAALRAGAIEAVLVSRQGR